jgi:hypothetical protein
MRIRTETKAFGQPALLLTVGRKPDYAKRFVAAARGSHPYSKNKGAPKLAKAASALLGGYAFWFCIPMRRV